MAVTREKRLFDRFSSAQTLVDDPFNDSGSGSGFVDQWFRRHGHKTLIEKVELAACGIEIEGNDSGQVKDARILAEKLRKVKNDTWDSVIICCVYLYTRETFLYRVINQTLRNNDTSKLETLGPFCWFLYNMPYCEVFVNNCFKEQIYRGATLDELMINKYKEAVGKIKAWNGFSSASKNPSIAETFGTNVLFVINTNPESRLGHSIDISSYSQFPEEEEVLIRAGRNFRIDKVIEPANSSNKYFIYVTII